MSENKNLLAALVKSQLEIKPPYKDKVNPQFKSRYVSLDSIYDSCRETLAKNGLILSHDIVIANDEKVLVTKLIHVSGESMSNVMPILNLEKTPQKFASALTYARRYAVCCLLALPSDEDDDGEEAEQTHRDEKKKLDENLSLAEKFNSDVIEANNLNFDDVSQFVKKQASKSKTTDINVIKNALQFTDRFLKAFEKHKSEERKAP